MNRAQRVVGVIGLGLALWTLGHYLTSLGSPSALGWVAYAPLSGATNTPRADLGPGAATGLWIALVAIWVGISLLLLRTPTNRSSADDD